MRDSMPFAALARQRWGGDRAAVRWSLHRGRIGNRLPGAIGIERTHSLRQLGRTRPKILLKYDAGVIDDEMS